MRLIYAAILALAVPSVATSQDSLGFAFLGLAKYRGACSKVAALYEGIQNPAITVLWGDFGTYIPCLPSVAFSRVLIYLGNGSCRRGHRCSKGAFLGSYTPSRYNQKLLAYNSYVLGRIAARANKIKTFLESKLNPETQKVIALELEDDLSCEAASIAAQAIKEATGYAVARNPNWSNSNKFCDINADFYEFHAFASGMWRPFCTAIGSEKCLVNNDGSDIRFSHRGHYQPSVSIPSLRSTLRSQRNFAGTVLIWQSRFNGRNGGQFTPPHRRSIRISNQDTLALNTLALDIQAP